MRKRQAFTLIELLIVVAIIAILAAIAVPNFMEAQMRSKVTRCKADMKTMQTAMEMYRVDNGEYIPDNFAGQVYDVGSYQKLTTPIAYMATVPISPFIETVNYDASNGGAQYFEYWRHSNPSAEWSDGIATGILYRITSFGPDAKSQWHNGFSNYPTDVAQNKPAFVNGLYDTTNGTKSLGDLLVSSKGMHNN